MSLRCARLSGIRLVLISVLLGVMLASCESTYDRDRMAAEGPRRPADPPAPSTAVARGQQLFESNGCMGCHMVNGQGGTVGPDLSNEGSAGHSAQWLRTQIRDPKAHDPQAIMPSFSKLSDQQVNDLVAYLDSLKQGRAQAAAAAPTHASRAAAGVGAASLVTTGGQMWSQTCGQCHNLRPPAEYSDAQWAVAVHHMRVRVPLTGQEQRDILAFLQASN
jgi:mono/diheme cytochrome c family protein